jgi:glucose/arabinose dehydrogenase
MKRHGLVPLLLIATLAACQSTGAPAPQAASLNQEIQLAPKQQAAYGPQGLTVEFVRVIEDSRCPSDVECVWAGEVKVEVATRINTAEAGEHATVGAFRVAIVNVHPVPVSTRQIPQEEYRVTLKVE